MPNKSSIFENLNPQQLDAVRTINGPLLILAGAGSGKTKVLTHRLANMIVNEHIQPENILAVTFTNKASKEMKHRFSTLLSTSDRFVPSPPWMGTFHSICVRILKIDGDKIGYNKTFSIYDSSDQIEIIKEVEKSMLMSPKEINPHAVSSTISNNKNEMVSPTQYEQLAQGMFQEAVAKIYSKYQSLLKERNAMDFDDILVETVRLFTNHPDILFKYQNIFKYIMIDEYQDTNHVQYLLVNMLAKNHQNIAVVGDDNQSIYSFRGADIRNIFSFEKDYKNPKVIKLEQNYRSTQTILDAADDVIRKNKSRMEKKLWTTNGTGSKIIICETDNEREEAMYVLDTIASMHKDGIEYKNFSILYRTNAQSRVMEEYFLRDSIPYTLVGGIRFYDRKEIKDIISYLRAIYNVNDDLALKRIVNTPPRGIGAKTLSDTSNLASALGMTLNELFHLCNDSTDIDEITLEIISQVKSNKNLANFISLISTLKKKSDLLNPEELIDAVLKDSGYLTWIDDGTIEAQSRVENIKELMSVANKYSELGPQLGLSQFLEDVSLIEQEQESEEAKKSNDSVTLMTLHAAKGLEFENVFLIGLEEGLFPHSRVFTDPTQLEEERRLAYVGITRAKQNLHLIHAKSRMLYGNIQTNQQSRFLSEISNELVEYITTSKYGMLNSYLQKEQKGWDWDNQELEVNKLEEARVIDYTQGDRVKHEKFGIGTVMGIKDGIVTVAFTSSGIKKLAIDFANLTKLDFNDAW